MQNWKVILQSRKVEYVLVFLAAISFVIMFAIPKKTMYDQHEKSIIGIILKKKIDGNQLSIILKGREKVALSYTIQNEAEKEWLKKNYMIGEELQANGEFYEVSSPTIFYTFSYKDYLYYHHIGTSFKATSLKKTKDAQGIYIIRNWIESRILQMPNSRYLKSFILGDSQELDNDQYRSIGISHLFAISGMHITFFIMGLEKILSFLSRRKEPYITIFLIFYLYIIGWSASLMRAVFLHIGNSLNQKLEIGLSKRKMIIDLFLIFIIVDPFFIKDLGFLYSFLISFSLTYIRSSPNRVVQLLKTSFIATMASVLITAPNFYEISLISIISNIIFVPYVTYFLFPMSILTLFFPFLIPIYQWMITIFEGFIYYFNQIPFGMVILPKTSVLFYIIYGAIFYLYLSKNQKKYLGYCCLILLMIKMSPYLDSSPAIYYLDVGQGDSSLIVSEHHKEAILIDTGGIVSYKKEWQKKKNESYQMNSMITFFYAIGVEKISLILSHGDYDHMGEAINLVNNFKVEKVIFNCGEFNDLESELIKVLDKKKIKYYSCIKELKIDNNKLYFLQTKEYDNENDNSNVIYTELDGYKFMFMGDASTTTEREILDKYNLPNIDILKVGHHGSKTSSGKDFINEINPKYSVISVGKNNRYGHPNKEVLENLNNSKIYRTDQDGSIMFKIKNNKLKIETCSP